MLKFLKTCLIIGVICIALGFAASAAGLSLGGLEDLKSQVMNGQWSFNVGDMFGIPAEENALFEKEEYSFSAEGLRDISVKGAGVTIQFMVHNGEDVLIYASKLKEYRNNLDNGELTIRATGRSNKDVGDGRVEILLPQALCDAGQLDIEVNASAVVVDMGSLTLNELDLDTSACKVVWDGMKVQDLAIDMAAGALEGAGTYVTGKMELDMQAGALTLAGSLGAETEIDSTAGKVTLELEDACGDYGYDVSCAGGSVKIGEHSLNGVGKEVISGSTGRVIDIECSAGAVEITFDKE